MSDLKENLSLTQKISAVVTMRLTSSLVDFCLLLIVASPVVLVKYGVQPYTRGFFCDDTSIKLPYKPSTFSTATVALICLLVPTATILVVETVHHLKQSGEDLQSTRFSRLRGVKSLSSNIAPKVVVFLFGGITTILLTDLAKYSLGVLRPHFLAVCQPNWEQFNCSEGYITQAVCTGNAELVRDARLSFPSRHASFSAFAMGFVVLYIEANVHISWSKILKFTIQILAVSFSMFCGFSRIFDNMHHWSDVLAGFALGILLAFICASSYQLLKVKEPTLKPLKEDEREDVNVRSRNVEKSSLEDCEQCHVNIESQLSTDLNKNSKLNTVF